MAAYLTPSESLQKYLTFSSCSTTSDYRRSAIVTYYAYAMDVSTDLMSESGHSMTVILLTHQVIPFPIPVLPRLMPHLARKLCSTGIFGMATICICVASVCGAKMASTTSGHNQPSPPGMAIWLIVESTFGIFPSMFSNSTVPGPVSAVVVGFLPTLGLLLPPVKYTSQPNSTTRDNALALWTHPFKSAVRRLTSDNKTRLYVASANESKAQINGVSPASGVMATDTFEVSTASRDVFLLNRDWICQVDEPSLSTLSPATLAPARYTWHVANNWW
ncbi:hypothetical protein EPUS_09207 [Endocarpon pusillum Z07020]|uniref:Uncharacterized protein n=1 Tax=Endocarpon pusillum (strain Z07020 / HMAS-L-300199) TaxID=1263415 RepID=U1HHT4_ENDPU|nr:uncharacterized protein EPUS_09207 [Endocarpon pusillum Z07020]ERF69720.1 hypothetical protein EPUS_09207 [Endocarpon pusillum Z07020]